jgi:hypothetical protein
LPTACDACDMRLRRFLPIVIVLAVGCGGSGDYEREAAALCRGFNEDAFAGHVEPQRAGELYGRLGDGLAELSPPDDLRRAHEVVLGFARSGERLFARADPDGPTADLALTVGEWEDDIPRVERDLPDCATSLTGAHPEIKVIR